MRRFGMLPEPGLSGDSHLLASICDQAQTKDRTRLDCQPCRPQRAGLVAHDLLGIALVA
jgi:hypothetical protein